MAFSLLSRSPKPAPAPPTAAALPEPGRYEIDPAHSSIEFVVRHLVAAKVRGRFGDFAGVIDIAEQPEASSVEVTIQTASIDTRAEDRDGHLRSADFFDVEQHPTATFRSTGVSARPDGGFDLDGELTIAGTTRAVRLDLTYAGTVSDPWGNTRIVFSAETEIDREDFGLTWNQALESGGVLVGRTVKIEIEAEAIRAEA